MCKQVQVQHLHKISDAFSMGDNYAGNLLTSLHKCILNHLTGTPVRILGRATGAFQYQQVHHTQTHSHTRSGYLSSSQRDWCQSPVTSDQLESVRIPGGSVCANEGAHVHACVISKAVTRCVWWKAPDVACLLMCNKEAQLGQKAKEANGRERRVEWGKEGISLKEIMEGWGQGASLF